MHPQDAEEDAPRKRRPRRRRSSTSEERADRSKEPEAAAFLEPPPVARDEDPDEDADSRPAKPAKKRARKKAKTARKKRARRTPAKRAAAAPTESEEKPEQGEQPEAPAAETADTPAKRPARKRRARRSRARSADAPGEASSEPAATEPGETSAGQAVESGGEAQPARRRRPRRSRKRAASGSSEGRSTAAPEAPDAAPEETASTQDSPDVEDASEPKRRPRRKRKRSRRRKAGSEDRAVGAEPDLDAPPAPVDDGAVVPAEAGADAPAPAPGRPPSETEQKSGKRKRGGRDKRKRGRKEGEGRERGRRGGRRSDGRKSDGRKSDGRKSDGRRSEGRGDRRHRDPRAIDIVPRAPTPEETAREKVLLVNASDREEARIALLVDGVLEEVYIETASSERSSAGNIYRGRVQNVERGIGAAFVDLGRGVTGFLHASDLPLKEDEEASADVTERLHAGDEVIVQITRDSIGRKGPALTGRISFAGRYLVLMPFTARSGISRRIPQGRERDRVRKLLRKLEIPEGMGVIVRTASETTDLAALDADLAHLLKEWEFIERKAAEPGQPGVLRGESDLAERSVRDIMPSDVARIVVDRDDIAGRIHRLLRVWYPSAAAAADEAAHAAVRSVSATMDTPRGEIVAGEAETETGADPEVTEAEDDADAAGEVEATASGEEGAAAEVAADVEALEPADDVDDIDDVDDEDDVEDEDEDEADASDDSEDADEADLDAAELEEGDIEEGDLEATDLEEGDDVEVVSAADEDDADDEEDAEPEETPAERLERLTRMARTMPEVELHTDALPLFHKYGAETQLEDAFRRSTRLPCGGSIVIDPTEALVAVDVNSGRLTDESDPESTALVTNLEAVQETARQLRLRDLGGLVVIDFIDMRDRKSRKKVETALREALSGDRARIRMGRMGPFGLVVLSRQRIRQALSRVTHDPCGDCGGTGYRRQIAGLGLRVLREMEARVARSRGRGGLGVRAPQEVVTWIKKNRSGVIKQLKKACNGPITLEADARLAVDGWAMKGLPPEGGQDQDA